MTSGSAQPRCDDVRREILASGPLGDGPRAHLANCGPCRLFAARLAIVDDGLEADAALAASSPIAPQLRARILAAATPGLRPLPQTLGRARWSDVAVRAAAVAAVLVGAIAVLPAPALADELSMRGFLAFGAALSEPIETPLLPRALTLGAATPQAAVPAAPGLGVSTDDGALAPIAVGALTLLAAGLLLRRRP